MIAALLGSVSVGSAKGHLPQCPGSPLQTWNYSVYENWTNCIGTVKASDGSVYFGGFKNGTWSGHGTWINTVTKPATEYVGN